MASTNHQVTKIKLRIVPQPNNNIATESSIAGYTINYGEMLPSTSSMPNIRHTSSLTTTIERAVQSASSSAYNNELEHTKQVALSQIIQYASAKKFATLKDDLNYVTFIIEQFSPTTLITDKMFKRLKEISVNIQNFKINLGSSKRTNENDHSDRNVRQRTQINSLLDTDHTYPGHSMLMTDNDDESDPYSDTVLDLHIDFECNLNSARNILLFTELVPDDERYLKDLKFAISPVEIEFCWIMKPRFVADSVSFCELEPPLEIARDFLRESPEDQVKVRFCAKPETDKEWAKKQKTVKHFYVTDMFAGGHEWKQFIRTVEACENPSWCWDICLIRKVNSTEPTATAPFVSVPIGFIYEAEQPVQRDSTNSGVHTALSGYRFDKKTLANKLKFLDPPGIKIINCVSPPTLTSWKQSLMKKSVKIPLSGDGLLVRFCPVPQCEIELLYNEDCLPPASCLTGLWKKISHNGPFDITTDYFNRGSLSNGPQYTFFFGSDLIENPLCYGVYEFKNLPVNLSQYGLNYATNNNLVDISTLPGFFENSRRFNNEMSSNVLSPDSGNVMNASDEESFHYHEAPNANLTHYYNNNNNIDKNNHFSSEGHSNRHFADDIQKFIQTNATVVIQDSIDDLRDILTNPAHQANSPTSIFMRALGQMDIIDKLRRQFPNVHQPIAEQSFRSGTSNPFGYINRHQSDTVHSNRHANSAQSGNYCRYQSSTDHSSGLNSLYSHQPTTGHSNQPSLSNTRRPTLGHSSLLDPLYPHQPSTTHSYQPNTSNTRRPTTDYSSGLNLLYSNEPTTAHSRLDDSLYTHQPTTGHSNQPSSWYSRRPTIDQSSLLDPLYRHQPTLAHSNQLDSSYSHQPTTSHSSQPSSSYTRRPTIDPSSLPDSSYSHQPTIVHSSQPSSSYTRRPTSDYSSGPNYLYSNEPTTAHSSQLESSNTRQPTSDYSSGLNSLYSNEPTTAHSSLVDSLYSHQPTTGHSNQPSSSHTRRPTTAHSSLPESSYSYEPITNIQSVFRRLIFNQPTTVSSSQPSSLFSNQSNYPGQSDLSNSHQANLGISDAAIALHRHAYAMLGLVPPGESAEQERNVHDQEQNDEEDQSSEEDQEEDEEEGDEEDENEDEEEGDEEDENEDEEQGDEEDQNEDDEHSVEEDQGYVEEQSAEEDQGGQVEHGDQIDQSQPVNVIAQEAVLESSLVPANITSNKKRPRIEEPIAHELEASRIEAHNNQIATNEPTEANSSCGALDLSSN